LEEKYKFKSQIIIKKLDIKQLEKLKVAEGFTRWVRSTNEKSKKELKHVLFSRLMGGTEVWGAIVNNTLVGFMIVSSWTALPGAKIIDAIEIVKHYRGKGIGSKLLNSFLNEYQDSVIGLLLYPEAGYEDKLIKFYKKHGFEDLEEGIMIRFPSKPEKLMVWVKYIQDLRNLYDRLLKIIRVET